MLRHLAPVIISETVGKSAAPNAAFKVVEELIAAIKDHNVKNVAVSADYGAGDGWWRSSMTSWSAAARRPSNSRPAAR